MFSTGFFLRVVVPEPNYVSEHTSNTVQNLVAVERPVKFCGRELSNHEQWMTYVEIMVFIAGCCVGEVGATDENFIPEGISPFPHLDLLNI